MALIMAATPASVSHINSLEDLFRGLESRDANLVQEIQRIIREQFQEEREPWLVHGLYDYWLASGGSASLMELLLGVPDPHDKFLCDKMLESLRRGGVHRLHGLSVLGYVIRQQPPWLYRVTQHSLMKELLKTLKHEDDLVILMSALLDLLALMPIVPSYMAPYLHELFDVFSRIASWRYQNINDLPQIQKVHVQIGLFAFFHRLYGMFPCNFLSYLRSQYSETHKDNQLVFNHTIRPMLHTVRMHPLLVTHSRDQEKHPMRWKKLELHDILVESSRYSLISQEGTQEDQIEPLFSPMNPYGTLSGMPTPDIHELASVVNHDPLWTPGKRVDVSSPPGTTGSKGPTTTLVQSPVPVEASQSSSEAPRHGLTLSMNKPDMDSPPEAAIEATPESTPFVTPVKDDTFRFTRPGPTAGVSRQLRLDGTAPPPRSPKLPHPLSPMKEHVSPFRFDRRDSIFVDLPLGLGLPGGGKLGPLDQSIPALKDIPLKQSEDSSVAPGSSWTSSRPSPVKFTSQRPEQFPIKPEPERPELDISAKIKQLAMDHLDHNLDMGKEEDDPEVSDITGGGQEFRGLSSSGARDFSTRHITPRICGTNSSGTPSRATSRLSTSSQPDPPVISSRPRSTVFQGSPNTSSISGTPAMATECKSGGIHPPSSESVNDFVRQVRGRIRYFSMCAPSELDIDKEVQGALKSMDEEADADTQRLSKRASSCPEEHLIHQLAGQAFNVESPEKRLLNLKATDASIQTDEYVIFPYEHLFPSVLPVNMLDHGNESGSKESDGLEAENPYDNLDRCVESAIHDLEQKNQPNDDPKALKNQITLLHNLMLFERHRREILGTRNRRLLGKTKSSRILEEENTALRDQLQIVETEIQSLLDELETVRQEKHRVEQARAKEAKQRDEQIEELVSRKTFLKDNLRGLETTLEKRSDELNEALSELTKLEAGLFRATSEIQILEEKDKHRKMAEGEVVRLRQEIILLGEIHQKYREQVQQPSSVEQRQEFLFTQAFEQQLGAMEGSLMSKSADLEAARARINDLEQGVTKKDMNITELKKMIKIIKEENLENVHVVETANSALMETQAQLEARILQLQDKLSQANRVVRRGGSVVQAPPLLGGMAAASHSANVDIRQPIPEASALITDSAEKSFIVGSPPMSSDNGSFSYSLGSNEAMRRAVSSGPINLDQFVEGFEPEAINRNVSEPEIGSAVSAAEAMRASSSSNSMNGHH